MMSSRKKILHTNYTLKYGGIQEVIRILIKYSSPLKFEHFVLSYEDGDLGETFKELGARVIVADQDSIASFVSSEKIDIVLSHTINGSDPWSHRHVYDLIQSKVPIIAYLHCSFLCQAPLELFRAVITGSISNWTLMGKSAQVRVIPYGIDIEVLTSEKSRFQVKKEWNIPQDSIVIGRISRLENEKLISETIKAMFLLKKELPHLPITFIIGGGESIFVENNNYMRGLKKLSKYFGIDKNILFTDMISNQQKADLLEVIDVYLAPSSMEGYGIVFCEAMAKGIPIVTYDHLSNVETIGGGGVAVEFGDIEKLVEETKKLVLNPNSMDNLGKIGKNTIKDRNDPQIFTALIEEILEEVAYQNF